MPRGGRRAGAGRKPKAELFARPIAAAEKQIVDRLPELVAAHFALAFGGTESFLDVWEPAGLIMIEDVVELGDADNLRSRPVSSTRTKTRVYEIFHKLCP